MKLKDIPGVMLGEKECKYRQHQEDFCDCVEFKGFNKGLKAQGEVEVVLDRESLFEVIVGNTIKDGWYPSSDNKCDALAKAISDNLPSILKVLNRKG